MSGQTMLLSDAEVAFINAKRAADEIEFSKKEKARRRKEEQERRNNVDIDLLKENQVLEEQGQEYLIKLVLALRSKLYKASYAMKLCESYYGPHAWARLRWVPEFYKGLDSETNDYNFEDDILI
jgi:hypothetical protein